LIEAVVGYPDWLLRAIGHPVTWIGRLIAVLDRMLNRDHMSAAGRRIAGIAALLVVVGMAAGAASAIERSLLALPFGLAAAAVVSSTPIPPPQLHPHPLPLPAAPAEGRR